VEIGILSDPVYTRPDGSRNKTGSITVPTGSVNSDSIGAFGGAHGVLVQISGTWSGTLNFQSNVASAGYVDVQATNLATGAIVTSTTANGIFMMPAGQQIRVYASALASGQADVFMNATFSMGGQWSSINDGGGSLTVDGTVAVTGTVSANQKSSTATTSSVSDQATNATLLSLNANRLGATIYNDSTATLYVKLGTTATTTDFTVILAPGGYYEVPFGYTGRIDGIWASDQSGAARITELT
jgi:hypothetical protein